VVGQGNDMVEWIGDAGEGSAYGILDYRRVDDEPIQSAAGAPARINVKRAEVGDNFNDEFVGE